MGKFLRDADNKLQLDNAHKLEHLVGHCQVIQGKKKSYINILMRDGDGMEAGELLEMAFSKLGKRQWDPPPGRAVQRELKEALRGARSKK